MYRQQPSEKKYFINKIPVNSTQSELGEGERSKRQHGTLSRAYIGLYRLIFSKIW